MAEKHFSISQLDNQRQTPLRILTHHCKNMLSFDEKFVARHYTSEDSRIYGRLSYSVTRERLLEISRAPNLLVSQSIRLEIAQSFYANYICIVWHNNTVRSDSSVMMFVNYLLVSGVSSESISLLFQVWIPPCLMSSQSEAVLAAHITTSYNG